MVHIKRILKKKKNWAKDLNRHSPKEDLQITKRHMRRCSTSFVIREMQIKTTMRYHFTPTRITILQKKENKCQQGCGETGTLYTVGKNIK